MDKADRQGLLAPVAGFLLLMGAIVWMLAR